MSKIRVRATRIGYYGHKRRYPAGHSHPTAGEPFYLEDLLGKNENGKTVVKATAEQLFSKRWMQRVTDNEPVEEPIEDAPAVSKPEPVKPTGNQEVI